MQLNSLFHSQHYEYPQVGGYNLLTSQEWGGMGGGGGLAQGLGIRLFAFGGAWMLSPLLILTLCGSERVLVVSMGRGGSSLP